MSLTVSADLLAQAQRGDVDDAAFVECVRTSLPYAWGVLGGLIAQLESSGAEFTGNHVRPELLNC